jgi:MFS family permease
MAGDAGSLAGPLIAGFLADTAGYGSAFGLTAAVLVVAAGLGLRAPETLTPEAPAETAT